MSDIDPEGGDGRPADPVLDDPAHADGGAGPAEHGETGRTTHHEEGTAGTATGQGGPADAAAVARELKLVLNTFTGQVFADGSTFGFGATARATETTATGRVPEAIVTAAAERYARPRPYEEARGALRSDGVVVLTGDAGSGKRTGAVALLRDLLPVDAPIWSLSPVATLPQLAGRGYEAGHGYVVLDWFGRDGDREAEHAWHRVSTKIREARAHLVVTMAERPRRTPESARHVAWLRPDPGAALRAHLDDATPREIIEEVVRHLPAETSMTDLARIARLIDTGAEPRSAVDEVLDRSKRQEVRDWFDGEPSRREILDITTLAFLSGVGERAFDTARARLEAALDRTLSAPVVPAFTTEPAARPSGDEGTSVPPAEAALTQDRQRVRDNPLIALKRKMIDGVTRRGLVFRTDAQRRYVLEELDDRFGVAFWDAVRSWLAETVADDGLRLLAGAGLAQLAYSAFDEIESSYLNPWAAGEEGLPGRLTAVYTLLFMSFDEGLAPVALRTAARWAGHGDTEQRRTAVVVFAGDLGVRYPIEAAQRLWQLVAQHNDLSELAAEGFGTLFATLTAREARAGHVVSLLDTQVRTLSPHGRTRVRYRWTLRTALAVVQARNPVSGHPAITEYLVAAPNRVTAIARIWAALLKHRPARHRALVALLKALRALESLSADAERDAQALGDALGDALPAHEHVPLMTDVTNTARRLGEGLRPDALAKIMLAALDRGPRRALEE